jgi:hypothetical protein
MKKILGLAIATTVIGGVFVAGVAVGKAGKEPKFITRDELKWDDVGGPKLATVTGDSKKGPYIGLMQLPGGFTSPWHGHSGDYEAIQIEGTSTHWVRGEDGTKAKKMTPGSYWSMPGKLEHISQCEKGKDCLVLLLQKTKFDFIPGKEDAKKPDDKKPADVKKPDDKKPEPKK